MSYTIDFEVERGDDEDYHVVKLSITGSVSKYIPAKTWGPPENCYPAEGGEVEIESILHNGKVWDGELTEDERESAEEQLRECQEDDGPDPDDYFDDFDGDRGGFGPSY